MHQGLIQLEELDFALARAARTGERLGRVLLAEGFVSRQELHHALAQIWDAPFIDLLETRVDESLVSLFAPARMAGESWVPVRRDGGGVLVATSERPTEALRKGIETVLGGRAVRFAVTTDWDVQTALLQVFRDDLAADAGRPEAPGPGLGGVGRAVGWQWGALLVAIALGTAGAALAPRESGIAAALALCLVVAVGALGALTRSVRERRAWPIADEELPVYTLLVPLLDEDRGQGAEGAGTVAELIAHLAESDYPRERLQIVLLMERGDRATITAARAAAPPESVRFVLVPRGPRSRERALNLGLAFARGELVAVYGARDRPASRQLQETAATFAAGGPRRGVVECRGGSLHFRALVLRALGGWRTLGPSADADLRLRALEAGHRMGRVSARTRRAGPRGLGTLPGRLARWRRRQRADLHALIVHARSPLALVRGGNRALVAGVSGIVVRLLMPIALPVLALLGGLWIAQGAPVDLAAPGVTALSAASLAFAALIAMIVAIAGVWRED